ncbi:MAG TPA: hypothetical protein VI299_10670 [Polyangiales bacterium]
MGFPSVHLRGASGGALAGLVLALSGCVSRSAPASYPANAASSRQAPELAPGDVTVALRREPPLPGQSTTGWPGLAVGEPANEGMHHGGHHHAGH